MKKLTVIINPTSGGGRTLSEWPRISSELLATGHKITQYISSSEADFREKTRMYARKSTALAICGGDSSLTIAAEELAAARYRGELVFLPAGSANDIVLDIDAVRGERAKAMFLGELTTKGHRKNFIGQANWGLGVIVNRWVGKVLATLPVLRPLQQTIGTLSIILAHILRRERVRATLHIGNRLLSGEFSIILVTQLKHWASGLRFAPDASYYVPQFQIVTVRRTGLLKLIRIILASKNGAHVTFPEVEIMQAQNVTLKCVKPTAAQIDGDILRAGGHELLKDEYQISKRQTAFRLSAYH